ncbi:molybdenum cofactor biosynthesis F family protein [Saccharothrix obliqua]|uniref:molybdenum cofactor biosynthesis F family protein n=1 Tax=Saccharothrix obliqua TaxID=2861747 RepID=UPI001C604C0B|nr:molybdenum cofactor biosynthesis F family protein [Saccharothrix obliqua]MBW4717817.1 molybdenum cofactor biosynthesis F family protein [Saccharothrix obliqua]
MSDWKTVDDFAAGIDGNRLPSSTALKGRKWTVRHDEGGEAALSFGDESTMDWTSGDRSGSDWYQAVEGAPGIFFISRTFGDAPRQSEVLVADVNTLRTLTVETTIAEEKVDGVPQVSQVFRPGVLDAGDGREPSGEAPAPTRELIGFRALYRYSPNHLYEHVYLSSERYAWQCLVGEQRGHGDVDLATAYKIAENRYVFTFREFRIPVATTWLYDMDAMRTTGTFFGLNGEGQIRNAPGGAHIIPLGRVEYPGDDQPV